MREWKVYLTDGAFTIVRVCGEDVSLKRCLEILEYRGYEDKEIVSIEVMYRS